MAFLVACSFLAFGACRSPVPGVNEPQYLSKAKHAWNPGWCAGDFFLESANAHAVFYDTIGWLTRFASLEQTAYLGRILAYALLAVGWTELVTRLVPGQWAALWAAWIYLAIAASVKFSGEWIVGGVEAKVFAYGFAFGGLAFAVDRRWNWAALLAGAAVAFHPVVGVWSLFAAGFAGIAVSWQSRRSPKPSRCMDKPGLKACAWCAPLCLLAIASLPGLFPAVRLLSDVPREIARQADYIQVFYRLRHHLDPTTFTRETYAAYAALIVTWLVGRLWAKTHERERYFYWFVMGSALIALAGLLIGLWPAAPDSISAIQVKRSLLKFYPFRLFDVMVPLAVAVTLVGLGSAWLDLAPRSRTQRKLRRPRELAIWLVAFAALVYACASPAVDSNPSRLSRTELDDWLDVCGWISRHTPHGAQVVTPHDSWAFKWYAERAEFVCQKDCPQNARGIVEWNRRLRCLRQWAERSYDGGYSREELAELAREEHVTHMIAHRLGPIQTKPIYRNGTYRVYRLIAE